MAPGKTPKERWHVGREIPLAVIITLLIAFGGNIFAVGYFAQKVTSFMDWTKTEFSRQEIKIDNMGADKVHRQTVLAMLETRDAKIDAINISLAALRTTMQANTALLQKILFERQSESK